MNAKYTIDDVDLSSYPTYDTLVSDGKPIDSCEIASLYAYGGHEFLAIEGTVISRFEDLEDDPIFPDFRTAPRKTNHE